MTAQRSHLTAQVHKANRCQHGWKVKGRSLARPARTHGPRLLLSPRGGLGMDWLAQHRLLLPRGTLLHVISSVLLLLPFQVSTQVCTGSVLLQGWPGSCTVVVWALSLLQSAGASLWRCRHRPQGARHLSRLFFIATPYFLMCRYH